MSVSACAGAAAAGVQPQGIPPCRTSGLREPERLHPRWWWIPCLMFKRYDEQFERTAADPLRRRVAIGDLSQRRTILFWCALVIFVCAIVGSFSGKSAMAGLWFAAAVQWSICFKFECDLRLLRVIERLHIGGIDKASG